MALRGLFFDFDGTLAETERDGHRVAYNRSFEDLGLAWHWDAEHYGRLLAVAGGRERIEHFIASERPPLGAEDARTLPGRIHARKAERFAELAPGIALRPGVARIVAEAHAAGLTLGVVTTARADGVRSVLRNAPETLDAFAFIVAGDDVAAKKPAPDAYRAALERAGLDARECLAVEDAALGLASARAAGIATLVTVSRYSAGQNFAGAAAVVTSLGDAGDPACALVGPQPEGGIVTLGYLRSLVA